jgi:exopolysaccharide biosynthesis polyprenyl glycosylphosphotransferase
MDQGRVTIGHRLPVEAPNAVAATIRTVRGLEAGLNAGAERLSRPPLVHTLPLIGDGLALLLALSLLRALNPIGVAWLALALVVLKGQGAPHRRLSLRVADDLPGLSGRLAISLLVLAPFDNRMLSLSRFGGMSAVAIGLVVVGRLLSYTASRGARRRGLGRERVLLLGKSPAAIEFADTVSRHPESGMIAIGFLTGGDQESTDAAPVIGDYASLERTVKEFAISRVIVALDGGATADLGRALELCQQLPIDTYVIPPFAGAGLLPEQRGEDVIGMPVVYVPRSPLQAGTPIVKRALDIVVAATCLAIAAPLFAAAALLVRLSSPGPVFLHQERIGRGGRVFDVLKFRTMYVNSDSDTTWSVLRDNRVTGVGKILRRSSIDELPQLINVLRGEMSLIGPRPERPHFVTQFAAELPSYRRRHRSDVGITGWAQVHGFRGPTSIADRVRLDNYYIEHWSVWMDLVILARTVKELVRGAFGR